MRRVLMVSPHFPPDTSAGTHRVRLLAPHLSRYGWDPTVVTVDPRDYEGRLDPGLAELVPPDLRVVRCRAWSAQGAHRFGVGDLGLRAWQGLYQTCERLLRRERFDVLFITLYPTYPALLGPILKRRFRIPFILDYQDPWVGSWGKTVGPRSNGRPNLKSRLSRALASLLEPLAVRAADAVTAVSPGTYEEIQERLPYLRHKRCEAIPLGGEAADFERLRTPFRPNPYFDPGDGQFHLCYVGTLLPLGFETLRAVLHAVTLVRRRRPELYARLWLRFFGTSNQTLANAPRRVLPVAEEIGVADRVVEVAPRIDYLEALTVQTQATALLLMGSSERHYTASKLYPGLLARRPLLAVYHEASSVTEILRKAVRPPTARLVTYNDLGRAESRVESIYAELLALMDGPVYDQEAVGLAEVEKFSAQSLAGRLAAVLDEVRKL